MGFHNQDLPAKFLSNRAVPLLFAASGRFDAQKPPDNDLES